MEEAIFPAALALRALRSTSYKDTAYAVAELVDNSFDAGADEIGVALLTDRPNGEPHTIAVLDAGRGMSGPALKHSVQYGFSGHDSVRDKPLGKFGVGLVAASFSQCTDLTVMSWQDSEAKTRVVPATGIAFDESMDNTLPDPEPRQLPEWVDYAFFGMPTPIAKMTSGTLVIWRDVKSTWKRATTLSDHLTDLCGRIYRNFIEDDRLLISVGVVDLSAKGVVDARPVPAVDPMFLTNWADKDLSDSGFVGENTLFDPYTGSDLDRGRNQAGEYEPEMFSVEMGGVIVGSYLLTSSYRSSRVLSKELVKRWDDPGDAPYGRLARRLQGVSILRSEREIDLDPSWLRLSQTVDRWVSVSLDFDPDLDEVFGVSNDKQKANRLAAVASMSLRDIRKRIKEEEDGDDINFLKCLEVAEKIKDRLNQMQRLIREQRRGERSAEDDEGVSTDPTNARLAELVATGSKLSEGGSPIPQDGVEPRDHPVEVAAAYGDSTSDGKFARDVRPPVVIEHGLQVDIVGAPHETSSRIFGVSLSPGHMVVHLNKQHPLYSVLSGLLVPKEDRAPDEDEPTIQDAVRAVRSLLVSYARAQVEAHHHHRNEFERCVLAWGEVAERVFKEVDE